MRITFFFDVLAISGVVILREINNMGGLFDAEFFYKGSGAGHVGHEYFCKGANKSAFSTQVETASRSDANQDNVLLQVIKIPRLYG